MISESSKQSRVLPLIHYTILTITHYPVAKHSLYVVRQDYLAYSRDRNITCTAKKERKKRREPHICKKSVPSNSHSTTSAHPLNLVLLPFSISYHTEGFIESRRRACIYYPFEKRALQLLSYFIFSHPPFILATDQHSVVNTCACPSLRTLFTI